MNSLFAKIGTNIYKFSYKSNIRQINTAYIKSCDLLSNDAKFNLQQIRSSTSFFTRLSAQQLWKGVVSVSNAGRKRGRGKGVGRKTVKDLNKGQVFGTGRKNMSWPGLNVSVLKGKEIMEIRELPEDVNYENKIIQVRNEMDTFRKKLIHPLERGWSGKKIIGRWLGPPPPVNGESFPEFNTKVLMMQSYFCMRGQLGRQRTSKCMVVTGNKNGCAGFAIGRAKDARTALKKAVDRSIQQLRYFKVWDNHTINHDFFSRYGAVKVFAHKKPPGFGIVAHRVIQGICKAIGIQDIYVKVEGPVNNYMSVTRAFFHGLGHQKSFQEMADEKQLHVVEFREDKDWLPIVMASPSNNKVRTKDQIPTDEVMDFHMYLYDGCVREVPPRKIPAYTRSDGYNKYLQDYHYQRSREAVRVYLKAKYGSYDSFLTLAEKKERAERRLSAPSNTEESEDAVDKTAHTA